MFKGRAGRRVDSVEVGAEIRTSHRPHRTATTVALSKVLRDRIRIHGRTGMSHGDVIAYALDFVDMVRAGVFGRRLTCTLCEDLPFFRDDYRLREHVREVHPEVFV